MTEEQIEKAWKEWNKQNHLPTLTPAQTVRWLEEVRELEIELQRNNPERRENFEEERFAYLKYWQKEIASRSAAEGKPK